MIQCTLQYLLKINKKVCHFAKQLNLSFSLSSSIAQEQAHHLEKRLWILSSSVSLTMGERFCNLGSLIVEVGLMVLTWIVVTFLLLMLIHC
jgi:hypothetical protein